MSSLNPSDFCVPNPPTPDPNPPPAKPNQVVGGMPDSLCSTGWQPILITGLCRDLLACHFRAPLNLEQKDLRQYVWREDERTGILIESIYRWRGAIVEKRPALIIKRNNYHNLRAGIADFRGFDRQGFAVYSTFWVGSHTVFCIHTSGAGADILATEVQRELTQFHPIMVQYLGLMKWGVTEVASVVEVEEAKESFAVPITVGWAYEESWRLKKESLTLRRIPLSILLGG